MPKYQKGTIAFTVEQQRGQLIPTGSWTIHIDDLNKILCEKFEQTYSRDVIWKVVKLKANLRDTRHRVRKKLPSHMGMPNTKKEQKAAVLFMVDLVTKHLNGFDRHIEKFLAAEKEEVAARTSPTFREFSEAHFLPKFIDADGERTGTGIRRHSEFRNWIWPVIGHLRLDEIKSRDIDALVIRGRKGATVTHWKTKKRIKLKPQSENTIQRWWTVVGTVLNDARSLDDGDVEDGKEPFRLKRRNPFDKRRLNFIPRRKDHTNIPPTASENRSLVEWVAKNDPNLFPLVVTAIFTGVRVSEALALEWSHVKWDEDRIDVVQQVCPKTQKIKPTKTGRRNSVPMLLYIKEVLALWLSEAQHVDEALKNCVTTRAGTMLMRGVNGGRLPICTSNKWIFARPDNTPYRYQTVRAKMNAALEAVGIKKKGQVFHAFRRAFCSEMAARLKGRGGLLIMREFTGHSTIQALEKYIYNINAEENLKALEEVFEDAYGETFLKSDEGEDEEENE